MSQVIINTPPVRNSSQDIILQDVSCGEFFNRFVESQKVGYVNPEGKVKKKGLSVDGAVTLKKETCDILAHCNPHNAVDNAETTHLAVGYVQSGKTMSFTGLTALALDYKYRLVVYLAGTKKNLRDQTADRLEKDLITNIQGNKKYFKIHIDPDENELDDIVGHLSLSSHPIILIPVLKHPKHIENLTKIFESIDFKDAMQNETVLIIDDEADQASLNSYGRWNSKHPEADEEKESSTYSAILAMRNALPGNTYIQYTATPQANILISMQDVLSPKSHTLLTPGKDYIGGEKFFGRAKNHELFQGRLIINIPPGDVFNKKYNPVTSLPKSLRDAILLHILATAIVVKWREVEDVDYLSMMVHVDGSKAWNKKFKKWIDQEFTAWRKALKQPDGQDDKVYLLEDFQRMFPMAVELYDPADRPTFEQILEYIPDVINDKKTYLVNTDKEANTKIEWKKHCMHILVGAEMLNRGFTIEKLATTYMPRYAITTTNADTIQQRCRFFGYKEDYIRSCRVFLPEKSIQHYIDYVEHERELRKALHDCHTLEAAERQMLLSEKIRPTRLNVLPASVVKTKMQGINGMQAFESSHTILNNDRVAAVFIQKHLNDFNVDHDYGAASNTHRSVRIPVDDAILFLNDFRFGNPSDAMRKSATVRYLRYLSSSELEHPLTEVYFVQMAFKTEESGLRERALDFERKRLSSTLLQGASGSTYLGDASIVAPDTITIQLHHIKFKGGIPASFPSSAYTLAINYPAELATQYTSSGDYTPENEDIANE